MKQTVLQESFSAGEISPLSRSRYGSEGYAQGCEILENMFSDPRGPAIGRDGFKHLTRIAGNNARIEQFPVTDNLHSLFVLTDNKVSVLSMFGLNPVLNYMADPRFQDIVTWTRITTGGGEIFFNSPNESVTLSTKIATDTAEISKLTTTIATGNHYIIIQSDGEVEYRVKVGADYDVVTKDLQHVVAYNATAIAPTVYVSVVPKATPVEITIRFICVTTDLTPPEFGISHRENELHDINFLVSPDASKVYMYHGKYPSKQLKYTLATDTWVLGGVPFVSIPASWGGNNYPSTGAVFQGRVWVGGTPDDPQTFWGSKSGVYDDFTTGAGAADALEFTMQKAGAIEWMEGTKNLLIGTQNAEHIVTSEGGVITGADIQIEQQSSYGSNNVPGKVIGDQVFYISPDGVKLRAMQYEWTSNNWLSRDITFFSQHITAGKVIGMAWAQHPDNILLMVLKSGELVGLNYERGENRWGWHRHSGEGVFKDVTSGVDTGVSAMIVAVQYDDGFIDIETTNAAKQENTDSWSEWYSDTPFTVFTGLDRFDGKTVQIIADGAVHPDKVVTAGQITLDHAANRAVVGLKFTPKLKLLPFEKGVGGSDISIPYEKNFHAIDVHILESANPLINGTRAPSRSPATPMGTPEPLTTGKVRVSDCGWDNETDITIEQDLPLPLIVTAVSGEIAQEKL